MTVPKKILVCVANHLYGIGLSEVLKSAGHVVSFVKQPADIDPAVHTQFSCLILGENPEIPLDDLFLCCIDRIGLVTAILIVDEIEPFESNKLRSLGANAILSRNASPDTFIHVLALLPGHWILNTEIIIPAGVIPRNEKLSEREWQVLEKLAGGLSVKDIAVLYKLSGKTVEAHKFNVMRKLDIHNKAQLIIWFIDNQNLRPASSPNGSL